jgi:serine/threonine-protein kinase RsbW
MTDDLSVEAKGTREVPVLALKGELDLASAELLETAVERLAADAVGLVCDLTQLSFVDSSGVRALLKINESLRTANKRLALVIPEQAYIHKVFAITDFEEAAPIVAELALAIAAVRA